MSQCGVTFCTRFISWSNEPMPRNIVYKNQLPDRITSNMRVKWANATHYFIFFTRFNNRPGQFQSGGKMSQCRTTFSTIFNYRTGSFQSGGKVRQCRATFSTRFNNRAGKKLTRGKMSQCRATFSTIFNNRTCQKMLHFLHTTILTMCTAKK
jgi:hypothetical protein